MARWDEILSLPVQNPPTPELSAADITWSKVEGWKETMDRLALIPYSRINDFVRGESNNKECPTRFHVEARRKRSTESSCKPKVDGILEYILSVPFLSFIFILYCWSFFLYGFKLSLVFFVGICKQHPSFSYICFW